VCIDVLKQKDAELFRLCEDRLKVVGDMMEVFGIQDDGQQVGIQYMSCLAMKFACSCSSTFANLFFDNCSCVVWYCSMILLNKFLCTCKKP
jgi:hypothetical protein